MDNENNKGNLLCNEFSLYPKNITAAVVLTQESITITNNNNQKQEIISLSDVIGCHILEGNKTTVADYFLCIFYYPFRKRIFKGLSRVRCTKSLGITLEDSDEMQRALAEKWKKVIKNIIVGNVVQKEQIDELPPVKPRRLIVYVNPFSGQGKAMAIYKEHVRSFFAEAEIKHQMIKTEYAGHAKELAKDLEVGKYDGIVIVSGDGLVHEVINGLMERQDWQTAIKTPIGIVPGGSGNALAAAIVYASTKSHPIENPVLPCLFEICRGSPESLDIMCMEIPTNENEVRVKYGMLGFVYGLIADIDIESEKLRFLGMTMRSNIYGVLRIATLRKYELKIEYLPAKENESDGISNVPDKGDAPSAFDNDLLVPFSKTVPSNWKTIDSDFIQFSAYNISHIATDCMVHSDATLNDGNFYLTQIKSNTTRKNMVKLWDCLENGLGLSDSENVSVTPCKAFRITPKNSHSDIMVLDGERVPFGPVQCQIHPRLARVFTCRK